MRIPPTRDGSGGSQRAWFLLQALCRLGPVHFVLISRRTDRDSQTVSLKPIEPMVESVTKIDIPEWQPTGRRQIGPLDGRWIDVATMRSQEAPRIPAAGLERIAAQLPTRAPGILFAGRLPSAVIMQALIDRGLLKAEFRFVDFDDIMSKFQERQLRTEAQMMDRQGRLLLRFDAAYIRAAEKRIALGWNGVSVCTDEDTETLRATYPSARVVKIPNVMERDLLPPRQEDGRLNLLFVGNLGFLPNIQGLKAFMQEAWPAIRSGLPDARLTIVGLNPAPEIVRLSEEQGVALHRNVPEVQPFYRDSDIVLVPILIGSGTRIKILEAMAHGRAIVTTAMGAEGLDLVHGRHAMVVEDMAGFAGAVIALARDPGARRRMVEEARAFQQERFGPGVMNAAVASALDQPMPARNAPGQAA
ncbi:MAG TPA: glycosyltransferase family 4 protein [Roseomonas sp.]